MKSFLGRAASAVAQRLRHFRRDDAGNVAIIFALIGVVLMLCIGAAVDVGRWLHARDQTAAAIDAAMLAGGRALQTNNGDESGAIAAAEKYYKENVTSRLPVVDDTVSFAMAGDGNGLTGSGSAYIKTPFLHFAGVDKLPLISLSQTEFARSEIGGGSIEVALMVDITGSMCNSAPGANDAPCSSATKLNAMKAAAEDLIKVVVRDDQSKFTTKVAIIPFSDSVRLPSSAVSKATGTPVKILRKSVSSNGKKTDYLYNRTENCVVERAGSNRYTDAPPGAKNYVLPLRLQAASIADTVGTVLIDGNKTKAEGAAATIEWKPNKRPSNYRDIEKAATGFPTCTLEAASEVMPLSSDKNALLEKIRGLRGKGGTAGQVGTAWAWYMLSPDWGSLWSGSAPAAYGTADLRKVAVLMTDGDYNTEYTSDGIVTGAPGAGSTPANDDSASQAKELCEAMKDKGVEVYTIGFQVSSSAARLLKDCATEETWFYDAKSPEQLAQSYRDIAIKLTELYLSK